jgi:hypothetical protein
MTLRGRRTSPSALRADGVGRPQREGTGVHLMMLDRAAGK